MIGGGLGSMLALMRNPGPTKKCENCGLSYPEKEDHCPYCHGLSSKELTKLKVKIGRQEVGRRRLGGFFFMAAVFLILVVVIINL